MRRLLLLATASLLLGGCNLVMAELPILTADDARGAPQLKPGVWLSRDLACEVDTSKPMKDWPVCAQPSIVTATTIGGAGGPESQLTYVLGGGEPQVMQFELQLDPAQPKMYMFIGVQPQRTDEGGRIIEARTWAVQCGPPPPPKVDDPATPEDESLAGLGELFAPSEAPGDDSASEAVDDGEEAPEAATYELSPEDEAALAEDAAAPAEASAGEVDEDGEIEDEGLEAESSEAETQAQIQAAMKEVMASGITSQPLPGLTIKDGVCLVRTIEPLRNAARESLQWDPAPPTVIYWVRDKAD